MLKENIIYATICDNKILQSDFLQEKPELYEVHQRGWGRKRLVGTGQLLNVYKLLDP